MPALLLSPPVEVRPLAKKNPYYAQVWYDSHRRDEDLIYDIKDGKPVIKKGE